MLRSQLSLMSFQSQEGVPKLEFILKPETYLGRRNLSSQEVREVRRLLEPHLTERSSLPVTARGF
ncbi:hypothetical protein LEMLEM_LOCUS25549, partial [Lemmus lemmus]